MIVLGVSILYKYDVVLDVIKDSHAEVVPIVFIAIGSAIFLIAFFGCCGAIFESECMILTVSTPKLYIYSPSMYNNSISIIYKTACNYRRSRQIAISNVSTDANTNTYLYINCNSYLKE